MLERGCWIDLPYPDAVVDHAGDLDRAETTPRTCPFTITAGRRNWTFAGSDEGGRRAAAIYTLIASAKLNDIDPQTWLADVLARINDHAIQKLDELLPWNWRKPVPTHVEAA